MIPAGVVAQYLLYVVLPLWLAAGLADWWCHRASDIARTSGARESLLHLAMIGQVGLPALLALLFEVNALVLLVCVVALLIHQLTGWLDTRYSAPRRPISPFEQHVHAWLDVLPFVALSCLAFLYWPQALALLGAGAQPADFRLTWLPKLQALGPAGQVILALALVETLLFVEELARGVRARIPAT